MARQEPRHATEQQRGEEARPVEGPPSENSVEAPSKSLRPSTPSTKPRRRRRRNRRATSKNHRNSSANDDDVDVSCPRRKVSVAPPMPANRTRPEASRDDAGQARVARGRTVGQPTPRGEDSLARCRIERKGPPLRRRADMPPARTARRRHRSPGRAREAGVAPMKRGAKAAAASARERTTSR